MKGIRDVRLRIQCQQDRDHAKILPISGFLNAWSKALGKELAADHDFKLYFAQCVGEILCGNSAQFINKPGSRSPVGKCALCGGVLCFEVQDFTKK